MRVEHEVPDGSVFGVLYIAEAAWKDKNWSILLDSELLALREDLMIQIGGMRDIEKLTGGEEEAENESQ